MPFRDAAFDYTVSMLALQFVPRTDLAVREMHRVDPRRRLAEGESARALGRIFDVSHTTINRVGTGA